MDKRTPLIAYAIERLFVAIKKKINQLTLPLVDAGSLKMMGNA